MNHTMRSSIWNDLRQEWDLIIIGGGITGAGIFNMATRKGYKVLLVEAKDFAFGTSSRSSKLVHGGFRYLANKQYKVTAESVRERERLVREARQLVYPLRFILPSYKHDHVSSKKFGLGVMIYDLLAPKWDHRYHSPTEIRAICPLCSSPDVISAWEYGDAKVDDARLVLRILSEAMSLGGVALNYAKVTKLLKNQEGQVCGVALRDTSTDGVRDVSARNLPEREVLARVVINATGPWSDELRGQIGRKPRLRKLRGSHLFFPWKKIPLTHGITMFHPRDRRAQFIFPWEGVTLIGTTDLDHPCELEEKYDETFASASEVDYLLDSIHQVFPDLKVTHADILATEGGVRPVVNTGAATPSQESRTQVIWEEDGLLTITGGKLTIYRVMAAQALNAISARLGGNPHFNHKMKAFEALPKPDEELDLDPEHWYYLAGRYGQQTSVLVTESPAEELTPVGELPALWAELRWAARHEAIIHLDDLLLRRMRVGLTCACGGLELLPRIRAIVQKDLGWDDARWQSEAERYQHIWKTYYSLPNSS
ncbi:MAG: glycerol-3-phosphate dehydrogenase/oxidase [Anaerolineaceae bacterium]